MKRVLVAYATMAGSTAEVAEAIGETLAKQGYAIELRIIDDVDHLTGYDAIVVGGPMILGWHRVSRRFLRRNRSVLKTVPFALFATAMRLTEDDQSQLPIPIFIDEKLAKPPQSSSRLSVRDRYAQVSNYARPMLRASRPAKPASIAFFGGRLYFGRLKWWAVLFALLIVRGQAGDKRNWEAIRAWARGLPELFGFED
jgi:menaquinone-dependent protoporphyrinogen oxidase